MKRIILIFSVTGIIFSEKVSEETFWSIFGLYSAFPVSLIMFCFGRAITAGEHSIWEFVGGAEEYHGSAIRTKGRYKRVRWPSGARRTDSGH